MRGTAIGARIIVATDGKQVVGFRLGDGTTFAVGTNGAGPGEYKRVASVSIDADDQVTVVDPQLSRVLVFDADGQALPDQQRQLATESSWNVTAVVPVLPGTTGDLAAWDHGLISVDGLEDSMRMVCMLTGKSAETLFEVAEGLWATVGGVPAKREAYGPRALVALDSQDGAAVSTGTDYTDRWWRPDAMPAMLRIEREWHRAPADHDLEPEPALLDGLGPTGAMLKQIADGQERGDVKNAVDKLVLVGGGLLLAKVVDFTAHYHPYYRGRLPELRPAHWTWEVFDAEGTLLGQLRLPSAFTPSRLVGCELWGVREELDGTQAIARADVTAACGWIR